MKLKKHHISLDLWYELSVHELRTGRIIKRRKGRCYSFVGNFVKLLNGMVCGAGRRYDFTDTTGVANTGVDSLYSSHSYQGLINASAGQDTYGSQVGTGTNSPAITNYQLATKILHGSTSGRLQYSAMT